MDSFTNNIISNAFNNSKYANIVINLKSGDVLYAHKLIVCNYSDYLSALFDSGMNDAINSTICFDMSDKIVFEAFYIIYNGKFSKRCFKAHKLIKFMNFIQLNTNILKLIFDKIQLYSNIALIKTNKLLQMCNIYSEDKLLYGLIFELITHSLYDRNVDYTNITKELCDFGLKKFHELEDKNTNTHALIDFAILCQDISDIDCLKDVLMRVAPERSKKWFILKILHDRKHGDKIKNIIIQTLLEFPTGNCCCETIDPKKICKKCGYIFCAMCSFMRGCNRCRIDCPNCSVMIRDVNYRIYYCCDCVEILLKYKRAHIHNNYIYMYDRIHECSKIINCGNKDYNAKNCLELFQLKYKLKQDEMTSLGVITNTKYF